MLQSTFALATKCFLVMMLVANQTKDYYFTTPEEDFTSIPQVNHTTRGMEQLQNHSLIFDEKKIWHVGNDTDVYVAVGYAMANMAMFVGSEDIVIVDTTESPETATEVMREFRKITSKPCKAVVITHYHADHYYGLNAVLEACSQTSSTTPPPLIITHSSTVDQLSRFLETGIISFKRAHRQFGHYLEPEHERINCGLGMELKHSPGEAFEFSEPTLTFDHNLTIHLTGGEELQFFHTPGETNDQITTWIPDRGVVFPGDNIYEAFPAVYTLRGASNRNIKEWWESLDLIRGLNPHHLVPSHTNPISGYHKVQDIVTKYRDALQFVHDQTVRWMAEGLHVDEIVERVHLPASLMQRDDYLGEFYGTIEGAVRAIYQGYYGWFDGNPANIDPLSRQDSIKRWQSLLGDDDFELMLNDSRASLHLSFDHYWEEGEHLVEELQWCMELTADIMTSLNKDEDKYQETASLAAECMRAMADSTLNAQQRNYYLTSAEELDGELEIVSSDEHKISLILEVGMDQLMALFPIRVQSNVCGDNEVVVVAIYFTDMDVTYQLTMRNCVMEIIKFDVYDKEVECMVILPSMMFRKLIAKQISFGLYWALRKIVVTGTGGDIYAVGRFKRLMDHFDVVG